MSSASRVYSIEPLRNEDLVAAAQCIAIDADAFPYASASFALHSTSAFVWIAREPGNPQVVGFVATRARLRIVHLDGLAVDSTRRRRGIGRALLEELVEDSRARGMRAIALHVSVANRAAIALYADEGFVVEGRRPGFYPATAFDTESDAYAMVLHL
jgi:ribosomal-protein-alanine N-acetyltransferase